MPVTITQAGTYLLAGSIADGSVIVNAGKSDTVHLVLDGVDITASDAPAIWAQQRNVIIPLAEGSANTLVDGTQRSTAAQEADSAAL